MKKYISICVLIGLIQTSCDDMNSIHQHWVDQGEMIYTGAVDSLSSRSGLNRILLKWQMNADPRINDLIIRWNNKRDSVILPINRNTDDKIGIYKDSLLIDDNLEEGAVVFQFYTKDNDTHTSVIKELTTEVFGDNYANSIKLRSPRKLASIEILDLNTGKVSFSDPESKDLLNTKLTYWKYMSNGTKTEETLIVDNKETSIILQDIRLGDEFSYESFFVPTEQALDGFPGKSFKGNFPDMLLPSAGNYEILNGSGSWCEYWDGWPGIMDGKGTYLNVANSSQTIDDGENCFVTKLGVEGTAWGLGLKINKDYSIKVYVAQFNGDWADKFEYCRYTPEKCFYDPNTGVVHFDYDVSVAGAWRIRGETHMIIVQE